MANGKTILIRGRHHVSLYIILPSILIFVPPSKGSRLTQLKTPSSGELGPQHNLHIVPSHPQICLGLTKHSALEMFNAQFSTKTVYFYNIYQSAGSTLHYTPCHQRIYFVLHISVTNLRPDLLGFDQWMKWSTLIYICISNRSQHRTLFCRLLFIWIWESPKRKGP